MRRIQLRTFSRRVCHSPHILFLGILAAKHVKRKHNISSSPSSVAIEKPVLNAKHSKSATHNKHLSPRGTIYTYETHIHTTLRNADLYQNQAVSCGMHSVRRCGELKRRRPPALLNIIITRTLGRLPFLPPSETIWEQSTSFDPI